MYKENYIQIGTLRVQAKRGKLDRLAFQRRLTSLLNTVDFKILGASPSGVLIIRRLDDPLPGKPAPQELEIKINPAWENALKRSLQEKYRNASHPVQGYIPPDAQAVFFTDEGEMLAALALDISRGLTGSHWWWTVALKNLQFPPEPDLQTFLCREIIFLPAIFHHLAEWQTASEVIAKLSPNQAFAILRALCQAFHLSEPPTPLFQIQPGVSFHETAHETVINPPWQKWLSSYASQFHLSSECAERAALLGIGLSLFHFPAKIRTASFTQAFHTWFLHKQHEQKAEKSQSSPANIPPTLTTISSGKEFLNPNQPILEEPSFFIPSVSSVSSVANTIAFMNGKNSTSCTYLQEWATSGLETELGGIFYLINLIERLNLLVRFHESCSQSELSPWAVLDLLAKALLEDRYSGLETDPLWLALNKLDGRELGLLPETLAIHVFSWIDKELPGIRAFLYNVLGDPSAENPEPEKTVLLYPARVYITSTHVDIVMSLENISIPVRIAGLDRDPGWMPEYARIILFHFV